MSERQCPSTFVIISEPKDSSQKATASVMTNMYLHMVEIYKAVSDPQKAIFDMARNKYFIMLVCEVCHSPQANKKYEVSTPNKEVMTLVPLARRGLKVACGLNSLFEYSASSCPPPTLPRSHRPGPSCRSWRGRRWRTTNICRPSRTTSRDLLRALCRHRPCLASVPASSRPS